MNATFSLFLLFPVSELPTSNAAAISKGDFRGNQSDVSSSEFSSSMSIKRLIMTLGNAKARVLNSDIFNLSQTHWHSFFVLSDIGSTMVLGGSLGGILKKTPLTPTILPLSSNKDDVFRWVCQMLIRSFFFDKIYS